MNAGINHIKWVYWWVHPVVVREGRGRNLVARPSPECAIHLMGGGVWEGDPKATNTRATKM